MKKCESKGMYLLCMVLFAINAVIWGVLAIKRSQLYSSMGEAPDVLGFICAFIWAVGSIIWWYRWRNFENKNRE